MTGVRLKTFELFDSLFNPEDYQIITKIISGRNQDLIDAISADERLISQGLTESRMVVEEALSLARDSEQQCELKKQQLRSEAERLT